MGQFRFGGVRMSEIKEIEKAIKSCKEEIKFYKNELKQPYMKAYLPPEEDYCKGHSDTYCKILSQIKTFEFIISTLTEKLEREQGWIPVSERFPEDETVYMVAWKPINGIVSCGLPHYYELFEFVNGEFINDLSAPYEEIIFLAWQPLPKPYKEVAK